MSDQYFRKESDISHVFDLEACVRDKYNYPDWSSWQVRELKGLFGIPDHLAIFWKEDVLGRRILRTFAFEMKREKWRRALMQAYRYASFAEYSFVVLDHFHIHRALANVEEFQLANIGLISVRVDGEVFWHHRPRYRPPYSKHMRLLLRAGLNAHLFDDEDARSIHKLRWISLSSNP